MLISERSTQSEVLSAVEQVLIEDIFLYIASFDILSTLNRPVSQSLMVKNTSTASILVPSHKRILFLMVELGHDS